MCLTNLAQTLWFLGYPDQALCRAQEALKLTQEIDHHHSQAGALFYLSRVYAFRGELQAAYEQTEVLIAHATEHGFDYWGALGACVQGWTLTMQEQLDEGIAQMQQGLTATTATGSRVISPWMLPLLAAAYGKAGQIEKGFELFTETLTLIDGGQQNSFRAETYRLKGELLLRQDTANTSQAKVDFQQAFDTAHQQQAKSLELRAAMSLARLWQSQAKYQDAYDLLAAVYEWFTEGFDTTDLKDAKNLLHELSVELRPPAT